MTLRNVFLHSFQSGIRQWRIAAIVYFLQLCLALTIGMEVYDVLQASIGHSLEINKLLAAYDHTVITDFLKVHGASITPLIGQLRWLLLTWLLFSVFTNGGMLYCTQAPEPVSWRSFWQGGSDHFFAFLKTSLFFLVMALVWTVMIWLPIVLILERSLQYFTSEKYTVWMVLTVLVVWLTGLAVLFVWSVISRLQRLRTAVTITGSIKAGWKIFRKNKARFMGTLAAFAVIQVVLTAVYFGLESVIGMRSSMTIVVVFLMQQAYVFGRILIRQMMYAAMYRLL